MLLTPSVPPLLTWGHTHPYPTVPVPCHLVQVLGQRLLQLLFVVSEEAAQALQLCSPKLSWPRPPCLEGLSQLLKLVFKRVHPAGQCSVNQVAGAALTFVTLFSPCPFQWLRAFPGSLLDNSSGDK